MSEWSGQAEFNHMLSSLLKDKPPPTQQRVVTIAKFALEHAMWYKHIVHTVEKYLVKSGPEHLLGLAYVMDAICRRSQAKNGDKDKFGLRFAQKLPDTLARLRQCVPNDKPQLDRVLGLWQENKVIPMDGVLSSSSSSSSVSSSSSRRVPSPHTPPGVAPMANRYPAGSSAGPPPMFGGPPMMGGGGGGPPPMLMGGGAPPNAAPSGQVHMQPIALDLDFNYGDDEDIDAAEAISEAKRRRLEEERRVNEQPTAVTSSNARDGPQQLLDQIMGIINQPEAISLVLAQAGIGMEDLIAHLQAVASPEVLTQLRAVQRLIADHNPQSSGGADRPPVPAEEEVVENGQRFTERWSTTVYMGNVPQTISESDLRQQFQSFGVIQHITSRADTGTAFVTFTRRDDAESCQMEMMNFPMHDRMLKTGWARGPDMREGSFDRQNGRGLIPLGGTKRGRVDTYGGKTVLPKAEYIALKQQQQANYDDNNNNDAPPQREYRSSNNDAPPQREYRSSNNDAPPQREYRSHYDNNNNYSNQREYQSNNNNNNTYNNAPAASDGVAPPMPSSNSLYPSSGRPYVPGVDGPPK